MNNEEKLDKKDVISLCNDVNKRWLDFYEKKEKRDFKLKISLSIIGIILSIALAIWFFGYWLMPPIGNYIKNGDITNSNVNNASDNNENHTERQGE